LTLNQITACAQQMSTQHQLPFDLSQILQAGLIKLYDLQEHRILLDSDF
jgi:hypothetical protein